MNLKEFDAKQFLLEKGERVGLGIAVTLMVLMLIFSLFMPSHGFFSGSPAAKAQPLKDGASSLQTALRTTKPRPGTDDSPPVKSERHLIDLDTVPLEPQIYETDPWYEQTAPVNPARRPPIIKNITEAIIKVVHIPIDTYIFNQQFTRVTVLRDPEKKAANQNPGGPNRFNQMRGMITSATASMSARGGRQQPGMYNLSAARGVQGADEKPEYETPQVALDKLNGDEHLARQLRPARMAIIAASFPYKAQLEEFKTKLRLASIEDVLNEPVEDPKDKAEKLQAFRFLGVEVQRKEFDIYGKELGDWKALDLKATYSDWLMTSGLPFEEDDPKYLPIKNYGLVWPRLRAFREESPQDQMGMPAGPMRGPGRPNAVKEAPRQEGEAKYPDLAGELPGIQKTLKDLADVQPQQISAPPAKFQTKGIDLFNPNNPPPTAEGTPDAKSKGGAPKEGETIYPENCLVRLIDVTVEPGRFYRYRVKIRMANPNYNNPNVASPDYKRDVELKSKNWFELPLTVSVPQELIYYVVDQKHLRNEDGTKPTDKPTKDKDTLRYFMWNREPNRDRQVVFQFHRWIEATPIVPDGQPVPIGEWSVADRVFVARGEYIGQKVKVDLPVWKYTLDSFVLPVEDQKAKKVRGRVPTGVTVNFGQDNSDNETILVDFEGGRDSIQGLKVDDNSALEVLMLGPDGKLRARNSAADTRDKDRENRRAKVLNRIEEVRSGKAGGANPAGGGLDAPRAR
ncbi:MAG TPA: hypothetical protein VN688_10350 [Gemmataceae bacterium]|nr:hypothetical protein [Gemmataceae bacterium]